MFAGIPAILCISALITLAGCAAIDEGYSAHYGLTGAEYPQAPSNPLDEAYPGGTVGIRQAEEYEEKYRERDVMERGESTETAEQ